MPDAPALSTNTFVGSGGRTTLTILATKTSESGYQFRAVFKNVAGEATSKAATLTVQRAPGVWPGVGLRPR